jgi:hypothetical protein
MIEVHGSRQGNAVGCFGVPVIRQPGRFIHSKAGYWARERLFVHYAETNGITP